MSKAVQYKAYLASTVWAGLRHRRLKLDNFKCRACGSRQDLQVHHLTYQHIFNEPLVDLISLCRTHHEEIERLIQAKAIRRTGRPRKLAKLTLKLLGYRKIKFQPLINIFPPRKSERTIWLAKIRDEIKSLPWFEAARKLERKSFKREVRDHFKDHPRRIWHISNAMIIYDYNK